MGIATSCFKPSLKAVDTVDVGRMLGTWKVVAVLPTPFEKNGCNPTEVYTWDEAKQRIDVDFTLNKGSLDGPVKSIPQKIYTGGFPQSSGRWQASPVWPIKLSYVIMDLDPEYKWVLVGHPSRSYLWLMGRETSLPQDVIDGRLAVARNEGFDLDKLEYPKHNGVTPGDQK
ncbi:Temperature-induced lipocalin-1 [Hondaea fermentalgiana]|uniref:Temperature-induced lipocalin-1 n=1 Tax=Hondaea fermentalgiana TaxID=2315210 RepID=A0A2R5GLW8_9STRA|nr:Temperature-induced lipocalin-1 [Hondaea fermentalgiana]|eukprot:GBG31309.1 Temperature-induced lipocalin-1 [Hondaea fermentalgiana]